MELNRNPILYYGIKWSREFYEKKLNNPAYLNLDRYFPEHCQLEEQWEAIRDEALHVLGHYDVPEFHDVDKGQNHLSNNDGKKWQIYVLKLYDTWIEGNIERCPVMYNILKQMPHVTTATLSSLEPGKHIPEHKGPYKGIYRYQLPLQVPKNGKCRIYVNGEPHYWKEGQGVLFDDTYPHEVKNESEEHRVALLLDVKRQDMPANLKWLDKMMYQIIKTGIYMNGAVKKAQIAA